MNVLYNSRYDRLEVSFPAKPDEYVNGFLIGAGFRSSPRGLCYIMTKPTVKAEDIEEALKSGLPKKLATGAVETTWDKGWSSWGAYVTYKNPDGLDATVEPGKRAPDPAEGRNRTAEDIRLTEEDSRVVCTGRLDYGTFTVKIPKNVLYEGRDKVRPIVAKLRKKYQIEVKK